MIHMHTNFITLKDVHILFPNFSGAPTKFVKKGGKRSFCIRLNSQLADKLRKDGYNVKPLKTRDGEDPAFYLNIAVEFSNIPPRIIQISSRGRVELNEDLVEVLDTAEIESVDITINPYPWELDGRSGVKAYLRSMYVTLYEDELDLAYNARFSEPSNNFNSPAENTEANDDIPF